MRSARGIGTEVSALPPLQAERRLRNRLPDPGRAIGLLDRLLETGDPDVEKDLRRLLSEYEEMLLSRLLTSPTARPRGRS